MSRQNKKNRAYRLELLDDASHKPIWSFRLTDVSATVAICVAVIAILAAVYSLIAFTPLRTTIPGYPDANTKRMAIQNAIRMDSLETLVTRWEFYSENLRRVVDGQPAIDVDSLVRRSRTPLSEEEMAALAASDTLLRKSVTESEQFDLSEKQRKLPIEDMHFFVPLKGVISQPFDPVLHPYVDITAPANSVVKSILDGTVIFAGWNDESGYTIQIQHSGDIVSIYKHNQKLLKKTGEKVTAGSPIALVGNTGSLTTGDHLHFELWYQGNAVDPARYINF